jgi:hypothetical protein
VVVTLAVTVFSATELDEPPEDEELELLLADPTFNTPPRACPPGGDVDGVVAFFASAVKAVRVFPVVGALIAATMPDWQWFPVVWPQ